jgi:hypothetical protein
LGGNARDVGALPEAQIGRNGKIERDGEIKASAGTAKKSEARKNAKILATPAAETVLNLRDLRPGDILAARWADEERNGTPGFWNHLAIVGTDGRSVVEAQKTADGIVTATVVDFWARYSDVEVFRFFDAETARRAAERAESRVAVETLLTSPLRPVREEKGKEGASNKGDGEKFKRWQDWGDREEWGGGNERKTRASGPRYSWSASLTPILREDAATENCVSLLRRAFWQASGVDYRWKTPDDLARWDKSGDFAKIGRL